MQGILMQGRLLACVSSLVWAKATGKKMQQQLQPFEAERPSTKFPCVSNLLTLKLFLEEPAQDAVTCVIYLDRSSELRHEVQLNAAELYT